MAEITGGINKAIQRSARTSLDWKFRDKADLAYQIYDSVNEQLFDSNLTDIVIGFDNRLKKAGEYYFEGDNISLKHHFDIRDDLTNVELVIAVLHNATHCHQDVHKGKGVWWHTADFKHMLGEWGIEVSDSGDAVAIDPDLFGEVLDKLGLTVYKPDMLDYDPIEAVVDTTDSPEVMKITKVKAPGKKVAKGSKMKKWSCACETPTNVRCATNLKAYCTVCMADFELQD